MIESYALAGRKTLVRCAGRLLLGMGAIGYGVAHAAETGAEDNGQALGEIVVTAQKYEQRLQDVPITVTEVSRSDLVKANVTTAYDLPSVVSSLVWTNEGAWVLPALRGVSTN